MTVKRELQVKKAELNVVEGVEFISKLELSKAKIDVSRAKLELKLARDALNAFKNKKEAALNVRTLKMASVKEKVDEYKSNLEKMVIYAPSDGVVYAPYTRIMWVMKKAAPGVVARPGDKLLELPDLSEFDAKVFIRQRDAALLKIGDVATVYATTHPERGIDGVIGEKDEFTTTRNDRLNTKTPQGNLREVQVTIELSTTLPVLRPGVRSAHTYRTNSRRMSSLRHFRVWRPETRFTWQPPRRVKSALLRLDKHRAPMRRFLRDYVQVNALDSLPHNVNPLITDSSKHQTFTLIHSQSSLSST